jgi:tRNA modification GTPase
LPRDFDRGSSIVVFTKSDLKSSPGTDALVTSNAGAIATSSHTGFGLDRLRTAIRVALLAQQVGDAAGGTAARAAESIRLACDSLLKAHELSVASAGEELIAAELRAALSQIGQVVGAVYTEDLLDRIFSRFCIGK